MCFVCIHSFCAYDRDDENIFLAPISQCCTYVLQSLSALSFRLCILCRRKALRFMVVRPAGCPYVAWRDLFSVRPAGGISMKLGTNKYSSCELAVSKRLPKSKVKGQGRREVRKFCAWRDICVLSGGISMKLGTNDHHVSGNCWKGSQGQRSKVKITARQMHFSSRRIAIGYAEASIGVPSDAQWGVKVCLFKLQNAYYAMRMSGYNTGRRAGKP